MMFAWIDEIQQDNRIVGNIFEIGCHHGKSTTCLGAMVNVQDEQLCVCDLFGDQDTNISGSGSGDLEKFNHNMAPAIESGLEVRIFQKNSTTLTSEEIGGNYRFFHIDGGHNCEEALSDLKLAADSLVEKGVIVLDDPFRPEWPGVTEAFMRFLDGNSQFRAIAVGFNKLIMVRKDCAELYLEEIRLQKRREDYGLFFPWQVKELPFYGYPLLIFYVPTYLAKNSFGTLVRKMYRNHGWMSSPILRPFTSLVKTTIRNRNRK